MTMDSRDDTPAAGDAASVHPPVSSDDVKRAPRNLAGASTGEASDARQSGWRRWWGEFRADLAHPEKQFAYIYYITAILAVVGSLAAGLWAFSERFLPDGLDVSRHSVDTRTERPPVAAPSLSIVVLPFENLSNVPADEYFADGITDSLTTDLSRALPGSFVVARETAFTYKGKAVDARAIGSELDVRYVLEGSVLVAGDEIRINAQLVDAQIGNEIWAERFDTRRSGILGVQDEIVGRLSRAIGLEVITVAARRSARENPNSAAVTDLVLRGLAVLNRPTSPATMIEARGLFEQAAKLQPDNVDALAGIATTYVFEVLDGYYATDNELRLQRAEPLLQRALALDDRDLGALKARAALLRAQGRFADAATAAKAVIALNPGEPWAYKEVALSMMYLGRTTEALDWFGEAERYGPRDPGRWTWLSGKGQALLLLGRDDEAIASLRAAIEANPADVSDHAVLAAAYALKGDEEQARAALARYRWSYPDVTVDTFRNLSPVPLRLTDPKYLEQRARLKEGLRKAGMPS